MVFSNEGRADFRLMGSWVWRSIKAMLGRRRIMRAFGNSRSFSCSRYSSQKAIACVEESCVSDGPGIEVGGGIIRCR